VKRVENVTGPIATHGEGPVWWPGWGGLRFMDAFRGDMLTLFSDGLRRLHVDDHYAAFVRPRTSGGYVVAGEKDLRLSDGYHTPPESSLRLIRHDRSRLNEGGTDPLGRLYAGSADAEGQSKQGELFLVDATTELKPSITVAVTGLECSNGIAFSPDGTLAYYVDSLTRRIDIFEHATHTLTGRRPFVEFLPEHGLPDGITVASDGSVWVAMWGGSCIRAYSPMGDLIDTIILPVPQVTACTFGGDDLDALYITTSSQNLTTGPGDEDGSLYVCHPGVTGMPTTPFAG